MITKQKGAVGVAQAILYYTELGYNVSVPLAESQSYDLVVERDGVCYRVEVKRHSGDYIDLRTNNGHGKVMRRVSTETADILFAITDKGMFEVPTYLIEGRSTYRPSSPS